MLHNQRKFILRAFLALGCLAIIAACSTRPPETSPLSLELRQSRFFPRWNHPETSHLRRRRPFPCAPMELPAFNHAKLCAYRR